MVMRAYAFTGRNLSVKLLLGTCYSALLALDIWVFCGPLENLPELFYIFMRGSGCFPNYGGSFMAAKIGVRLGVFGGVFSALTELYPVLHRKSPNFISGTKPDDRQLAATLMDLVSMTVMIHVRQHPSLLSTADYGVQHCYRSGYHTVQLGKYFVQQGGHMFMTNSFIGGNNRNSCRVGSFWAGLLR